jgi:hypothetical protein
MAAPARPDRRLGEEARLNDTRLLNLLLLCVLLVLPRALQRWRLPAPLTCLPIGVVAAQLLAARRDAGHGAIQVLAVLGMASLFLHAVWECRRAARARPCAGSTNQAIAACAARTSTRTASVSSAFSSVNSGVVFTE